jgi:hypothetical protein
MVGTKCSAVDYPGWASGARDDVLVDVGVQRQYTGIVEP